MTANTHMIDNQLDSEWLQARSGEYFLIRILSSANEWFVLGYRTCLESRRQHAGSPSRKGR
jgi:hypothetical protein